MGLNHHAQAVVDQKIAELWAAFKAGVDSAGDNAEFAHKGDFKRYLTVEHPDLADYLVEEKLA